MLSAVRRNKNNYVKHVFLYLFFLNKLNLFELRVIFLILHIPTVGMLHYTF